MSAFTLVELAIVLAVVGLLVGAVLAGTQFFRSSELNKIATTANTQQAGYIQFEQKYNGIPGDLIDAESYFGSDANCPNSTDRTPKRATCNGNRDGAITGTETFRAIQQMANAGYIGGQFSGVAGTGGAEHAVPGQNVPAGPNRSGIFMVSEGPYSSHGTWFDMPPSVVLQMGRINNGRPIVGFLTPKNAMGIDRKIDDGRPGSGTLIAYRGACTLDEANYRLSDTTDSCALAYRVSTSQSTATVAVVNGACNNTVPLGCTAGSVANDNGQTACSTTRTWHCNGSGGGTNATNCSFANASCSPVVNGACNNAVALGCASGSPANDGGQTGCGTTRTWHCNGSGGGTNATNCSFANACATCNSACGTLAHGGQCCGYTVSEVTPSCVEKCCGIGAEPSCADYSSCATCNNGTLTGSSGTSTSCIDRAGPPCCFLGEAEITMADGSRKSLRELQVGDRVKGKTRINTVLRAPDFDVEGSLYGINGAKPEVTGGHPFFTIKGWKAFEPDLTPKEGHNVKTTQLAIGDILLRDDGGYTTIRSIERTEPEKHHVFSPTVDGDNTYFANGFLVHNKCCQDDECCPAPVNGVCVNNATRSCSSGSKDFEQDMNGYWTWRCMGINGGANDDCCWGPGCGTIPPVNGVCDGMGGCSSGNYEQTAQGSYGCATNPYSGPGCDSPSNTCFGTLTHYRCVGTGGGSTQSGCNNAMLVMPGATCCGNYPC